MFFSEFQNSTATPFTTESSHTSQLRGTIQGVYRRLQFNVRLAWRANLKPVPRRFLAPHRVASPSDLNLCLRASAWRHFSFPTDQ